jgi:squalene-hopene/tetraprenyl-beta-curcumene cyclase
VCAHVRRRQLPDGGWNIYENGPSELNASVKAYFALKLAGHAPTQPYMHEARACILRLGGIRE